jgi:hypothetical protein
VVPWRCMNTSSLSSSSCRYFIHSSSLFGVEELQPSTAPSSWSIFRPWPRGSASRSSWWTAPCTRLTPHWLFPDDFQRNACLPEFMAALFSVVEKLCWPGGYNLRHDGNYCTEKQNAVSDIGHQDGNTPFRLMKFWTLHPHKHSFLFKKSQGHITPREVAIYIWIIPKNFCGYFITPYF